jgi:hypothetical protein
LFNPFLGSIAFTRSYWNILPNILCIIWENMGRHIDIIIQQMLFVPDCSKLRHSWLYTFRKRSIAEVNNLVFSFYLSHVFSRCVSRIHAFLFIIHFLFYISLRFILHLQLFIRIGIISWERTGMLN